ncbi:FMN reductase [Streptomyces sp. S.PB5]|uniref:FMN reductase n=1 Tax=Streptomyces sp. S.PB5 TaxID=3020844 RepID=UPI0025B12E45|nr:FMN reductase [Streptomyces sp. S.PB5]MDN3028883.1 FMN reductase [Streptomyces sp. S.PB5]
MKLVVVSAGLSVPSSTRLLGDRLAGAVSRRAQVEVRVVELRELAVEIAHNFTNGFPGRALSDAIDAVTGADGLIVVTPVFSASYSGLFKSFFDVIEPDALAGKPVLIAATGGTARHSLILEHALRPLFAYLKAVVVPTGVYAASEDWGAEGLDGRIERAAAELARLMTGLSGAGRGEPVTQVTQATQATQVESVTQAAQVPHVPQARPITPEPAPAESGIGAFHVVPFAEQLAALAPGGGRG